MNQKTIIIISVLLVLLIAYGVYAVNERKKLEAEKEQELLESIVESQKTEQKTKFGELWEVLGSGIEIITGSKLT